MKDAGSGVYLHQLRRDLRAFSWGLKVVQAPLLLFPFGGSTFVLLLGELCPASGHLREGCVSSLRHQLSPRCSFSLTPRIGSLCSNQIITVGLSIAIVWYLRRGCGCRFRVASPTDIAPVDRSHCGPGQDFKSAMRSKLKPRVMVCLLWILSLVPSQLFQGSWDSSEILEVAMFTTT